MNFFWGDSQGKAGEDAGAVVQTNSTFDLLSLPASEAGTFYDQLNKEIEGLRAKVDSQLKNMVEASRKDITFLETKLREIQSGESTLSSVAKFDLSTPLPSHDSNATEPVANLSHMARDKLKDGRLSPSEEARLIGIVRMGPVPEEGREDDEPKSNNADSQDRILQNRTSPDQSESNTSVQSKSVVSRSTWNPCSKDGLVLVDSDDTWKNGCAVDKKKQDGRAVENKKKQQKSTVDAIDKARKARHTPTSRLFDLTEEQDLYHPYDLTFVPDSYEADAEKTKPDVEKLNTIRNQPSLIDTVSEDGMNESQASKERAEQKLMSRGNESPAPPAVTESLEDMVLRKRQSNDRQSQEKIPDTASLEYTIDDTADEENSKHGIQHTLAPTTAIRRGKVDPPIDKKKVPSNPFYARRYQSQSGVQEEDSATIENVRSQSLTPTAMTRSPDNSRELASPHSTRPESAPPLQSSISRARMHHSPVSEDNLHSSVHDSNEKTLGPGGRMKNAVKRFLSPLNKNAETMDESRSTTEYHDYPTTASKSYDSHETAEEKKRRKSPARASGRPGSLYEPRSVDSSDQQKHYSAHEDYNEKHSNSRDCSNRRSHLHANPSKSRSWDSYDEDDHHRKIRATRSRGSIDEYYENHSLDRQNDSFVDHNNTTENERRVKRSVDSFGDSVDEYYPVKNTGRNSVSMRKSEDDDGVGETFDDLFVHHHDRLTGQNRKERVEKTDNRSNRRSTPPLKSRTECSYDYDIGEDSDSPERHDGHGGHTAPVVARSSDSYCEKVSRHSSKRSDTVNHHSLSNDDDYNTEISSALVQWSPPKEPPKVTNKVQKKFKKTTRRQPSPEKLMRTRTITVENASQATNEMEKRFFPPSHEQVGTSDKRKKDKRKKKVKSLAAQAEQPPSFSTSIVPHVGGEVVATPRPKHEDLPVSTATDLVAIQKTNQSGQMVILSEVQGRLIKDPYGDEGRYTGIMLDGLPHGEGTMHYSDGRSYNGEWRHGRWHGQGRALFVNGDIYVGRYERDRRHGKGRYEWSDGRVYDGEFVRNQRHGHGTYTWPDGASYVGEFVDGQRHGEGCYRFADGSVYRGEWQNGKYDGVGECTWASGRKYHGEWLAGQAQGFGVEFRPDGTIRHEGEWKKDRPVRRRKDP